MILYTYTKTTNNIKFDHVWWSLLEYTDYEKVDITR